MARARVFRWLEARLAVLPPYGAMAAWLVRERGDSCGGEIARQQGFKHWIVGQGAGQQEGGKKRQGH